MYRKILNDWDGFDYPPCVNECFLEGKKIIYDGCSSKPFEEALKFYTEECIPSWIYIGSGYKTWHNGRETTWNTLHHFFIKPHRIKQIRRIKIKNIESVSFKKD